MYTTKDAFHRDDTRTPLPTVCKSGHFVKVVVGAGNCGDRGEPLHIREVLRRPRFGSKVNIVNHFTGNLENDSNLCDMMTCSIPVRWADTMLVRKLTSDAAALTDKHSIKSGRY